MEIKVLGTGCAGCKALYAIVTQVVHYCPVKVDK